MIVGSSSDNIAGRLVNALQLRLRYLSFLRKINPGMIVWNCVNYWKFKQRWMCTFKWFELASICVRFGNDLGTKSENDVDSWLWESLSTISDVNVSWSREGICESWLLDRHNSWSFTQPDYDNNYYIRCLKKYTYLLKLGWCWILNYFLDTNSPVLAYCPSRS